MTRSRLAPGTWLAGASALCLVSAILCAWIVVTPPWLGLSLAHDEGGKTVFVGHVFETGPAASQVRAGEQLVALSGAGEHLTLEGSDLIEEPDFFDTWPEMSRFFARQTTLSQILGAPVVTAQLRDSAGTLRDVRITPRSHRPVHTLPLMFWAQLVFGIGGLLIGVWVFTLRREDWGARMYALTGAMALVFTHAASTYSTRELAFPGDLFRGLSALNHTGAIFFGVALCGLFLAYPRLLVRPRTLLALFVVAAVWIVCDITRIAPNQDWASRIPVMLEMLGALVLAGVQWRVTKGDAVARTALRWFAFCVLIGPGSFILLTVASRFSGLFPPIPQGYSLGFFLIMFAGLALGLRRYRLFDLDEWTLRILFWALAAVLFVGIELFLISVVGLNASLSLATTLVLALAYLPLRQWVWDRIFDRKTVSQDELFEMVLQVTFASSDSERAARWRELLRRLFDPLHIRENASVPSAAQQIAIVQDGLALAIPGVASSTPLLVTHPRAGRRLFSPSQAKLAGDLVRLMHSADESRSAFQQGVLRERSRIARDLHDDVSSPLLAGLSQTQGSAGHQEIRHALTQMRSIVSGVSADPISLADCMANIRYDAVQRLTDRGITVSWPIESLGGHVLDPERHRALALLHQEVVTNIIKHAKATDVLAQIEVRDGCLSSRIEDNGVGLPSGRGPESLDGQGLGNLRTRARMLGGTLTIAHAHPDGRGVVVHLVAPLERA